VGSRGPSERLRLADAPVLERFNPDRGFGVRGRVQSPHTDQLKPSKPAGATTREVSFGPFHLLPAQFLLLEGDKPVPLGSRALELLIVLLERPGELVSKQDFMARVWPNLFVEPANLTVHISALRRALRDGRDGNRFIIARLLLCCAGHVGARHMKFVIVNGRTPREQTRCALCCQPIGKSYLRELTTQLSYCDHRCYVAHCKIATPAPQKRARAS